MAKHGPELLELASQKGVNLLFEASVGGGIPIIGPLLKDLLANKTRAIHAIVNGTTNYILTRMAKDEVDFDVALKEAQAMGYAEPDPTNDVEGVDAAYKLAILSTLAFHTPVRVSHVSYEGISRLTAKDFRYARELGYGIKLLAIAKEDNGGLQLRVHPCFISEEHPLARVDGVLNAIEVEGDLVGKVLFHGRGAGALPTASAVVGDMLEIARNISSGGAPRRPPKLNSGLAIKAISQLTTRYYLRLNVLDRPGVLAQIAQILGHLQVSIASVIQKEADPRAGTAEIVITTHPSLEASVQEALKQLAHLPVVQEVRNFVRIEDWTP
jgi:homoserine dehydrogenase